MGNSSGDLREFLRNAEALKRQTVQKQQKNLTEEPEEYRDARRKAMRLYTEAGWFRWRDFSVESL